MADGLSIGSLSVSGGVTRLTGTSSKLDTEAIVSAAYEAKRLPAVRLEQRVARNEARAAALGELKTLLQDLHASVAGLRNPPGLLGAAENVFETKQAFVTGSGDTAPDELVGITVENRAAPGAFSLEVTRLATAHKLTAQPLGPEGQTLAEAWNGGTAFAGSLEIGLAGGTKATIAVDGAMSADDLRAAINAVAAQTGVQASIMSVSAGERRLVLTAAETGRAIEFADAGGDAITGLLAPTTLQAAQTALLAVDGVAIERTGNRIDDVLQGVTIDLYRAEPGNPLAVKVEPSLVAAKEQLVGFVEAYNGLRDFVARQSSVGADGAVGEDAALFGDRVLRSLAQGLSGLVGGSVPGLASGALSTLRDVGITMVEGGRLRLDEATLDSRLLARLDEVRRVFEFSATANAGGLAVYARSNALTDYAFTVAVTDADGDGRAESATLDGVAAVVNGGVIEGAPGTAYEGLKLLWSGRGNATIDLAVSPGLADQLYNALETALDEIDGPIQQSLDSLEAANQEHAQRIAAIEERATRARDLLIARLGAMESALSLANTMLTQVRAQMDAMNQSS
jgi:flagellar hook-associated protein 2